jgi:hypothetical protein
MMGIWTPKDKNMDDDDDEWETKAITKLPKFEQLYKLRREIDLAIASLSHLSDSQTSVEVSARANDLWVQIQILNSEAKNLCFTFYMNGRNG